MDISTMMTYWISDDFLFPLLQIYLVLFVLFAMFRSGLERFRARRGSSEIAITRGDLSMSRFYGTYAGLSGLIIAISLSVDIAQNHRVFWVVVDTILVAYVCLFNPWFRNLLMGWADTLTKIEKR